MKVIARGRQAGKTHDLIEWLKEGKPTDSYPGWSRILLCYSLDEAQRIRTRPDVDYRQVFSVGEWQRGYWDLQPIEIAVDNADLVLGMLLKKTPTQISVTGSAE